MDVSSDEDDLTAVGLTALYEDYAHTLEPDRAKRQARAAGLSALLAASASTSACRGRRRSSAALAFRHDLDAPDRRCELTAALALAVFSNGVNTWLHDGCTGDLVEAIDEAFDLMPGLRAEASTRAGATT